MIPGRYRGLVLVVWLVMASAACGAGGVLVGHVLDADSKVHLSARVYVIGPDATPYFPKPAPQCPVAVYYKDEHGVREAYACVAAGPFRVELPAGVFTVTIERGKEYPPLTRPITVAEGQTREETFRLERRFDLAAEGWYSGDLHGHVPLNDMAVVQLAEDVNVAFPITAWTRHVEDVPAGTKEQPTPTQGRLIRVDDTHCYWDLNTEYEIVRVNRVMSHLFALLVLGHQTPLPLPALPVAPVAAEARRQGAILDWDKHSWESALMLVPTAKIDTIELCNNHLWRQEVKLPYWDLPAPAWMNAPQDAAGWVEYGFQSYYALLNSGFVLRPGAGSANGVLPTPFGYSRVYVKIDGEFSYAKWLEGLRRGRSFATCGPMLFLKADNLLPGDHSPLTAGQNRRVNVDVEAWTTGQLERIELVLNGKVIQRMAVEPGGPHNRRKARFLAPVTVSGSSWLAARCYEVMPKNNVRVAHTGPIFFDDPARPLRPQEQQIEYMIGVVEQQSKRLNGKLPKEALAEYAQAAQAYKARRPPSVTTRTTAPAKAKTVTRPGPVSKPATKTRPAATSAAKK